MLSIINNILDWTEVWATLLPILVWLYKKCKQEYFKPIKIYLIIAIVLNLWANRSYFEPYPNNHFIYTINSLLRLFFFLWFFAMIKIPATKKIPFIVYGVCILLAAVDFCFREDFFTAFSSTTFTIESVVLLFFSLLYFLKKLKSDTLQFDFDAPLYIITGLAVYEAVCFPMFLTFQTLINKSDTYAGNIWNIVHNVAYIVFCLFIARAFYGSSRHTIN